MTQHYSYFLTYVVGLEEQLGLGGLGGGVSGVLLKCPLGGREGAAAWVGSACMKRIFQ